MSEVKASDLLLKIATDVEQIKEMIKLQSFQYTLILQKLSTTPTLVQEKQQQRTGTFEPVIEKNLQEKPKLSLKEKLQKAKELTKDEDAKTNVSEIKSEEYNFNSSTDDVQFKLTNNAELEPFNTGIPNEQEIISQQVPITQLVYTSGGKPVALGAVEVKDKAGKVINKTKTNSAGRWSVVLIPGEYTIHFLRKYANEIIDYEQNFVVEPSSKPVELPPPERFRRKGSKSKEVLK